MMLGKLAQSWPFSHAFTTQNIFLMFDVNSLRFVFSSSLRRRFYFSNARAFDALPHCFHCNAYLGDDDARTSFRSYRMLQWPLSCDLHVGKRWHMDSLLIRVKWERVEDRWRKKKIEAGRAEKRNKCWSNSDSHWMLPLCRYSYSLCKSIVGKIGPRTICIQLSI